MDLPPLVDLHLLFLTWIWSSCFQSVVISLVDQGRWGKFTIEALRKVIHLADIARIFRQYGLEIPSWSCGLRVQVWYHSNSASRLLGLHASACVNSYALVWACVWVCVFACMCMSVRACVSIDTHAHVIFRLRTYDTWHITYHHVMCVSVWCTCLCKHV